MSYYKKTDLCNGYYKNVLLKAHDFPLPPPGSAIPNPYCSPTSAVCIAAVSTSWGREKKFDQKWHKSLKTELCFKNLRATTLFRNLPKVLPWKYGIQQSMAESSHGGGRGWGGRVGERPFLLIHHWA